MSTGLGLPLCNMAVEAHGGWIWVESELQVGTVFRFTIPDTLGAAKTPHGRRECALTGILVFQNIPIITVCRVAATFAYCLITWHDKSWQRRNGKRLPPTTLSPWP